MVKTRYLGEVGGVDPRGDPPGGDGAHVGDEPLDGVEADDVDALVRGEAQGQEALPESFRCVSFRARIASAFGRHRPEDNQAGFVSHNPAGRTADGSSERASKKTPQQ